MIVYFPQIYPDELVYSLFARYHEKSGSVAYRYTAEQLFRSAGTKPDPEYINPLTEEALRVLAKQLDPDTLIQKHTMLPASIRFLPRERKQQAYQAMKSMSGNVWNLIYRTPAKTAEEQALRYCPVCAEEDRKQYGETYWHRSHQLKGIRVCPEHACFLHRSQLSLHSREKPHLTSAEGVIPEGEPAAACMVQRELELAEFIRNVFQAPLEPDRACRIGEYLGSRLNAGYFAGSGTYRYLNEICAGYQEFYAGIPEAYLLSYEQIQKIYQGKRFHLSEICQLAMFEGIPAEELLEAGPDREAEQEEWQIYRKIAERMDLDPALVKAVDSELLKERGSQPVFRRKPGSREKAWEDFDRESLEAVKQAAKEIYTGNGEKPGRVTRTAVQKALGLPQKSLNRMPLCRKEIDRYQETQQQYWAREAVWAFQQVVGSGNPVSWKKIRTMTNMKKEDFQSCKPYLELFADAGTAEKLKQII